MATEKDSSQAAATSLASEESLAECVIEMTAQHATEALIRGTISSESLTSAFLRRISEYNSYYNAIITFNPSALEDARRIDDQIKNPSTQGTKPGPLAGVPVVIKDTIDMAGLPTTAGWHFLSSKAGGVDLIPERDSPVVSRLKEAGCVILGKTNVPVLSASPTNANNSWAGPTLNSVVPDRAPGASSAGTATAVGTSIAVLGLAEETGGSIQNPASAQGLVAVKPTFGLIPNTGVVPLSGSARDVVGPIARTVRDAALVLDVMAGYATEDPKTVASIGKVPKGGYTSLFKDGALHSTKLGLYGPGWHDEALSKECSALYEVAQRELSSFGASLINDPFANTDFRAIYKPVGGSSSWDARGIESVAYDMDLYLRRLGPSAAVKDFKSLAELTKAEDPFKQGGVLEFLNPMLLPDMAFSLQNPTIPPPLKEFTQAKVSYLETLEQVFVKHNLDALVYPQMTEEIPSLSSGEQINATTVSAINIAGIPAVIVPAGYYASGAPFNLTFVGLPWSEAKLLALAHDYEAKTHHRRAPVLRKSGE